MGDTLPQRNYKDPWSWKWIIFIKPSSHKTCPNILVNPSPNCSISLSSNLPSNLSPNFPSNLSPNLSINLLPSWVNSIQIFYLYMISYFVDFFIYFEFKRIWVVTSLELVIFPQRLTYQWIVQIHDKQAGMSYAQPQGEAVSLNSWLVFSPF